ncbi:alpha-E domain-containing protein [Achromobacter sp. LC458]|uniref:Alpha-E domain-containing protein n=1 Tax=Achromobacter spanius TaxID=217203 RepID=A0A2S5GWS1_9BURK|nr:MULTISPECIES: alpha-E domain-containing protein [Achromobacter]AYD67138.1 alpha-E domain-containing protein [Achromobacter sp. B7]MDX3984961.1 alpha-E domain-containing protein [Achromobacter sp.]PPA77404.1 alpha-E domain-containing protein [Achromobacter spanius]QYJ21462.1 alpha-E domain-containing protein [Achromobacter sp. ES-001]TRM54312.1 alpha-E domain-containing protein [Achromobacter sp. LC458]
MLSRTADNLFWMCRYIERAENTARMLDVNLQMSLLPQDPQTREGSWLGVLRISELQGLYQTKYASISPNDVLQYMVRDPENASSIYSCMRAARENARAVRGSLTTEVWETYNTTWLELLKHLHTGLLERNPGEFFEWVKFRSHLARGVTIGTMLEDEALYFLRIGMHLERADNTARMLDVKFHERGSQATTEARGEGSGTAALQSEFYRWSALLSSVSGLEIYRKVYRDVITPDRVAELLILHPDMPRSLLSSMRAVSEDLARVSNQRSTETQRRAGMLCAELQFGRVEDILDSGLHQYLDHFLDRINDLGNRISQDFLVPLSA